MTDKELEAVAKDWKAEKEKALEVLEDKQLKINKVEYDYDKNNLPYLWLQFSKGGHKYTARRYIDFSEYGELQIFNILNSLVKDKDLNDEVEQWVDDNIETQFKVLCNGKEVNFR